MNNDNVKEILNHVLKAIEKYQKPPPILEINNNIKTNKIFNFTFVAEEDVLKLVKTILIHQKLQFNNIPIKVCKQHINIYDIILKI